MSAHHFEPAPVQCLGRDTVGGQPILPRGIEWPRCACGQKMVFYFQLDVPPDVPTFAGAHLSVFQCPVHNDACVPCVPFGTEQLPPEYMTEPPDQILPRFWRAYLHRREDEAAAPEEDRHLTATGLASTRLDDEHAYPGFIKVGGKPAWVQNAEQYRCSCGAPMAFLAQVGEDVGFAKLPDAPVQPDAVDDDAYFLFLGNTAYFLACSALCDPRAVWPVNQN